MQDKKLQFRVYLIVGLMIAFPLVGNTTYTDAQGRPPTTFSSIQHELGDIKSLPPIQLDLRLAGTALVGKEYSYALIVEEMTGRQNLYSVGESIRGAKVLKIDKESIVVEKDGRTHVLKITGGTYTEADSSEILTKEGPPTIGVSEELPFFEPVFSETGPPVDENIHVEELPPFEPITNSASPPVHPEGLYEGLQEFVPFENDSGPPGV